MKKGDRVIWFRNYVGGGDVMHMEATFLEVRNTKVKILLDSGVIKIVNPDWVQPKPAKEASHDHARV